MQDTATTTYYYGPDVPLTFQPLEAPRPITRREAELIASREYGYRRSHRDASWLCLSIGADGGWHYRDSAYSEGAARGWCDEKRRRLAARIMRGECVHTLQFDASRDRFYLA